MRKKKSLKERLENFQVRGKNLDDCWGWSVGTDKDGYGHIHDEEDIKHQAHRVAYEIYKGSIPEGMCVLHSCDNPPCTNPRHLHLGTKLDNAKERNTRNRTAKGERHGSAKLTEKQVIQMRGLYENLDITYAKLGELFGVEKTTCRKTIQRIYWKHIPEQKWEVE